MRKLILASLAALAALLIVPVGALAAAPRTVTYTADTTTDFPNPERGFYRQPDDAIAERPVPDVRASNFTLVRAIIRLDAYRTTATLPQSFRAALGAYFAEVRSRGAKAIVRFAYNFTYRGPDASRSITVGHIQQVAPILRANKDSIAWFEAGFIGAWGQWHSSTNGHISGNPYSRALTASGTAIYDALMANFPQDRQIAVAYPVVKQNLYGFGMPLTRAEAWLGTRKARHAHHNDCFLANADDGTTWFASPTGSFNERLPIQRVKDYVHADAQYVVNGGETCNLNANDAPRQGCANAKAELAYQRWAALNRGYYATVLNGWVSQGCMPEIQRRLGYRFRLTAATLPRSVTTRSDMPVTLSIANDGYAPLPNQRPVNLVLRNLRTGAVTRLATGLDPRRWLPGQTTQEQITSNVPAGLAAGNYTVLLELPDPLRAAQARESIRFASSGTWEAGTGFNSLLATVTVK
jgi:Domain of unknown function (DUF4832)/Domain of unknown function (DUF4874)